MCLYRQLIVKEYFLFGRCFFPFLHSINSPQSFALYLSLLEQQCTKKHFSRLWSIFVMRGKKLHSKRECNANISMKWLEKCSDIPKKDQQFSWYLILLLFAFFALANPSSSNGLFDFHEVQVNSQHYNSIFSQFEAVVFYSKSIFVLHELDLNLVTTFMSKIMFFVACRHKSLMELLLSNVTFFMMENSNVAMQFAFCIENSVLRIFGMRFEVIIKIVKTALFFHRLHLFACVDMCVAKRVIHSKDTVHNHTQRMMY